MASGAIIIVCLWLGHTWVKNSAVSAAIEATKTSIEVEYNKKALEALNKSRETEKALREELSEGLKKKDEEFEIVTASLNRVIDRLRNSKLPSKHDTSPVTCPAAPKPTAIFYREDGEFLAREAARAEKVMKERDFYFEQYEYARRALASE